MEKSVLELLQDNASILLGSIEQLRRVNDVVENHEERLQKIEKNLQISLQEK